jgi:hypothetical protein
MLLNNWLQMLRRNESTCFSNGSTYPQNGCNGYSAILSRFRMKGVFSFGRQSNFPIRRPAARFQKGVPQQLNVGAMT